MSGFTGKIMADGLRPRCKPYTFNGVADARDARQLWPGWLLWRDA
ncbi:hypothetical protein ACVWYH_009219 [Bradyrhizobium sp. GM24.11]